MLEQLALRRSEQEQAIAHETELLVAKEKEKLAAIGAMLEEKRNSVQVEVDAFREVEMQKARTAIDADTQANQKWAQESLEIYWDDLARQTYEKTLELADILETIEDYKQKQQAINEAILRQRAIDEQQDFYRVCLSSQSKEDIKYLLSIIDNIKNKQLLYKLIWSEYLQKPFNELLKRLFAGKDPRCVIYKITNLKTGEIYIGKTKAEVSKRWAEHIKTSLNIGTVARSKIHDALFSNWDNFSFEVLERVEDETQLSSREKFYIGFYQSNISGYNMNSGG